MSKTTKPTDKGTAKPFSKTLGSDELFSYSQLEELHRLLKMAVDEKSMALIIGQAGVGKTTATRSFMDQLPTNRYAIIYLGQDQEAVSVWRRLAIALSLKPSFSRAHTRLTISQYLNDNLLEQGKDVILVVDEAHLLDGMTLEDIRLLTNTDFDRTSAVTVILLGQLQLRTRLKSVGFEALNQRLRYRYSLEGFSEEETIEYIKKRLEACDLNRDIFAPEALRQIFLASQGIPREINNYCVAALLKVESLGVERIDAKLIKQILAQRELN